MKQKPIPIQIGQLEFLKLNAAKRDLRDTYQWLLTLKWAQFAAFVLGVYMAINVCFATLYWLGRGSIAEMPPGSFPTAFFFSVETLATVGYGHMYPATLYGHIVTTLEIMAGMFGMAVITGLIFVRFSRPAARIVFSDSLVIAPFDGQPALMLRIANLRHHSMADAEFRMMLMRTEIVAEGDTMRRFYPLRLQLDRIILFPVALTLRHIIDEQSPLYGATMETLEHGATVVLASVRCVDTVIPAEVQSQKDYTWRDIRIGHRFVEIYADLPDGRFTVDYGRLHDTEPLPAPKPPAAAEA